LPLFGLIKTTFKKKMKLTYSDEHVKITIENSLDVVNIEDFKEFLMSLTLGAGYSPDQVKQIFNLPSQ